MNISKVIILIIIIVILYFVYLLSRTEKIENFLTQEQKYINTTRCTYLSTNVCEQNPKCQISNLNGITFCENKCEAAHNSFTKDQSECDKLEICNNAGNFCAYESGICEDKTKGNWSKCSDRFNYGNRDIRYCDPSSCQLIKSDMDSTNTINYINGRWNIEQNDEIGLDCAATEELCGRICSGNDSSSCESKCNSDNLPHCVYNSEYQQCESAALNCGKISDENSCVNHQILNGKMDIVHQS